MVKKKDMKAKKPVKKEEKPMDKKKKYWVDTMSLRCLLMHCNDIV